MKRIIYLVSDKEISDKIINDYSESLELIKFLKDNLIKFHSVDTCDWDNGGLTEKVANWFICEDSFVKTQLIGRPHPKYLISKLMKTYRTNIN